MKIDYCPKCGKAGLRYEDDKGLDPSGMSRHQRYEAYLIGEKSTYGTRKWCPRCKEWTNPENHPYVGGGS